MFLQLCSAAGLCRRPKGRKSSLEYIIKMTNYFVSYNDRALFSEVRRRYLPRPVPDAAVQVSSLSDPESAVEVEVIALVP